MKISKALGLGLFLHVVMIAALIIQPSCMTMDPPTQTYQQSQSFDSPGYGSPDNQMFSNPGDFSLDPAFNAGSETDADERFAPTRPETEFSEFDGVTPRLSPIPSDPDASTVEIAGPSFKIHTVQKGDSLWAISRRYSVSLDELYAANGLNKNSVLKIGQQIKIPVEGSTATFNTVTADAYQPTGYNSGSKTYTVVRGDTLSEIARRFNTSVRILKAANGKNSDLIRVGEKLRIPVEGSASGSSQPAYSAASDNRTAAPATSGGAEVHIVKVNEYPAIIARQYGMTTTELLAMNGITDPRKIQIGQKLKVSPKSSSSAPQTNAQPAPVTISKPPVVTRSETVNNAPVEIRVIEADPLIESDMEEIDPDSLFENAEEMPVVPMKE